MGHEKDCCKENRKNWMRERNARGGSEVDSCMILSILILKKSLKNVIQSLRVNWAII